MSIAHLAACRKMRRGAAAARTAKALAMQPGAVRVPECTQASHDALKRNPAAWSRLVLIGHQRTYDEPGQPTHLEMRNCTCGSTLCLPVLKRMHLGKIVEETTSEAA